MPREMTYNVVFPIALISQLCLHFDKLKYCTLESKNYSKNLFLMAVTVVVHTVVVRGTVRYLVVSRMKHLMSSINETMKAIPIRGFLRHLINYLELIFTVIN